MTIAAIIFMTTSVTLVVALAGWCYYQVLKPRKKDSGTD